ncbi:hypothetical protein OsJ_08605 [Oryza sativa Japonica Group]|uniref:ARM repeat superfamily protein n=1 Tax=Oryza sativa subsp. japonica TaxID=39947 RepID=B9F3J8_ORYSJ|nr:hypothetical protein OsJ_08605 [Oryza sativa Japonica Group]
MTMGVVSREVLPACERLCFLCPSLRTRSRHPVKRYKKLLSEIFPKSQDEEPNDRKIGKLCEYISRNPLRVPKITVYLEQKFYKELRVEHFGSVKVVMAIYRKVICSCQEQLIFMPNTHWYGLQVWFMGEHSHISAELDNVVSAVLENYESPYANSDNDAAIEDRRTQWVSEVLKAEDHEPSGITILTRVPSWKAIRAPRGELSLTTEESESPNFWSGICLHNLARISREATTVRRVLEAIFRYFDNNNLWSPSKGLALCVLLDMQIVIEKSGQNSHILLSMLVKHLEHKNVLKQTDKILDIIEVTTRLAEHSKAQSSTALMAAISDMVRHLSKNMQLLVSDVGPGDGMVMNDRYGKATDECLVQLSRKVGDAGPILDALAVVLENISSTTPVARSTIAATYRTAQIIASLPNLLYQSKAFPEALFHQLLLAMVYPDCSSQTSKIGIKRTLSRTTSVFSSSAALFGKLKRDVFSFRENSRLDGTNLIPISENSDQINGNDPKLFKSQTIQRMYSAKDSFVTSSSEISNLSGTTQETDPVTLMLSGRQAILLLSSLWTQALSPENVPRNYEAISHTYCLMLLFSEDKKSCLEVLVGSFQLAFSLQSISLQAGFLPPSRRRSLFTMATSMLVFFSKAFGIPSLIPLVKDLLTTSIVDPFLRLVEDCKLQVVESCLTVYGSKDDDDLALKSLSNININDQSKQASVSLILDSLKDLSEAELSTIRKQLLEEFSADDACPLGSHSNESTSQSPAYNAKLHQKSLEVIPVGFIFEDDTLVEPANSLAEPQLQQPLDNGLIDVNQLLESVVETSRHVGRLSVSTNLDLPFKEVANRCEALLIGKQQKLSVCMSVHQKQDGESPMDKLGSPQQISPTAGFVSTNDEQCHSDFCKLPVLSPYDKFLAGSGC